MKKKKMKYSLTAKERKENRKAALPGREPSEQEKAELEAIELKKKQSRKKIVRITAIVLSIVIAVSAITTGIVLVVLANFIDNTKVNPIATITLSNGEVITMELLYIENQNEKTDGRGPVANFIYLAESKFYDDTIFSNNKLGFLSMEGYTEPGVHRAKDENFVTTLKGFSDTRSNKWGESTIQDVRLAFKLGYRLTRINIIQPTEKQGYMAMLSGTGTWGGSTGFVLVADNSPQFNASSSTSVSDFSSALSYMAKTADAESLQVLKNIAAMDSTANQNITNWAYPTDYNSVRIKTVRISQLNSNLKKKIMNQFEEFVLESKSEMDGAIKSSTIWRAAANQYL